MKNVEALRYVGYVGAACSFYLVFSAFFMSNFSQFDLKYFIRSPTNKNENSSSLLRTTYLYNIADGNYTQTFIKINLKGTEEKNISSSSQHGTEETATSLFPQSFPRKNKTNGIWKKIQKFRQNLMQKTCHYIMNSTNVPSMDDLLSSKDLLSNILFDDIHRTLYCYIPKVACTQWKRIFMVLTGQMEIDDPEKIPHMKAHYSSGVKALSNKYLRDDEILEKLNTYKKFIIVRHPIERLLSAYKDKFDSNSSDATAFKKIHAYKMMVYLRKNSLSVPKSGDGMTFEEFLKYLASHKSENFQEHWMPYFHLCHPCTINYNILGKYETIKEDSDKLLEQMLPPTSLRFPNFKASKTKDILQKYISQIPKDLMQRLYEIFDLDFRIFGYQTRK